MIHFKEISFSKKLIQNSEELLPNVFYGPITYSTDGLITSSNCDFINEPKFAKAYEKALATSPWPGYTLQWRVYNVCWFADLVKNLEGDYVECGVNTGAYSRAVIEYINFNELNKTFYLFDTFCGLDPKQISEEEKIAGIEKKYINNYKIEGLYEQVKQTFSAFNVKIIKGLVPDTLPECKSAQICYISIDMNVMEPEIAAMNYFWSKIVKGGVVLLDDYGFSQHVCQKKAFDRFAKEQGVDILTMPTGQGIIIKI